jgi:hypothetical protein
MTPYYEYRWQNHVVRSGWWKLDLMLAAVSICVISAPFEGERGSDRVLASPDRPRTAHCDAGERELRTEIVGPSKKDLRLNGNCAQHRDARGRPSSDVEGTGPSGPSS